MRFCLPPLWSQALGQGWIRCRGLFFKKKKLKWSSFEWKGICFDNPLGIAGGLDKSAQGVKGWWTYGPGFLEVGTVTPQEQKANEGDILKKDIQNQALWNFMGFPNKGSDFVLSRLEKLKKPYPAPVFISIGKSRSTPIERAVEDYRHLMKKLCRVCDGFVLNISSPNTKDLRKIFEKIFFERFLDSVMAVWESLPVRPPLLLKVNPDLSDEEFLRVVEMGESKGIHGWVVCNSTLQREFSKMQSIGLQGADFFDSAGDQKKTLSKKLSAGPDQEEKAQNEIVLPYNRKFQNQMLGDQLSEKKMDFPSYGGVSGRPLADRSRFLLKLLIQALGSRRKGRLIVSCGGVMTPEDVLERLKLGADLVQVYTALVFDGPSFFKKTHQRAVQKI